MDNLLEYEDGYSNFNIHETVKHSMDTQLSSNDKNNAPQSLTFLGYVLILFGIFAFVGSVFLWGEGLILNPPENTDLAFPITDILINAPASISAGIGLIKLKNWAKKLSWFVSGFYVYASIEIFVQILQEGGFPLEIIIPQVLAVIVALALMRVTNQYDDLFT